MQHLAPITPLERVQIAGLAQCDPRTVAAYLSGRPVRPSMRAHIIAAIRSLGWTDRARFAAEQEPGSEVA